MNDQLIELNHFFSEAAKATYAGGGKEVTPWRKEFKDLDYRSGDWYYRDNYVGFFQSWGQEIIYYKGKPLWTSLYGGGMTKEFHGNTEFATKTFTFLKKCMSAGNKSEKFQPRGPNTFSDGDWEYRCKIDGNITKFQGFEEILYEGKVVFTHTFIGGLVIK